MSPLCRLDLFFFFLSARLSLHAWQWHTDVVELEPVDIELNEPCRCRPSAAPGYVGPSECMDRCECIEPPGRAEDECEPLERDGSEEREPPPGRASIGG